jgi:UrcA family protein
MLKTFFAATLALTVVATPAFAEDGAWRVGNDQIHLIDSSIDTRTAEGRAQLLAKVEKAAERLCRDVVGPDQRTCEVETVRQTAGNGSAAGRALTLALRERSGEPALAAR